MGGLLEGIENWLDPQLVGSMLLAWGGRIVSAILIFVIGRWLALALTGWIVKAISRAQVEETLTSFFRSLIYMTVMVFVVLTAVGALGVPTTNFLAILGAAGLAIGLALKDSLSNFSSGVMLVFFRPFKVGDYIEAAGIAASVDSIGMFHTVLKTADNRVITVPNSLIYGGTITNFSAESTRRIDLVVGIGYDDDIARARELIKEILDADERISSDPAPGLMLLELADSSINFAVRPWVKSADYWTVRAETLEQIKLVFDANGISIPYPQQDLHIVSQVS